MKKTELSEGQAMDKLLKLLDSNARLTDEQLATMLNMSKEEVRAQISKLEIPGGLQRLLDHFLGRNPHKHRS